MFKIIKKSKTSKARLGLIETAHGVIATPLFMPDGTRGVIKHLSSDDLIRLDLKCLVANTLHLYLRPGIKLIKQAKGLHNFINWQQPILSDSGGYQVYSLIHKNKGGTSGKITDHSAIFRSPRDGSIIKLSPEQSIKIQFDLGVEMMVCLDDCPPNNYNHDKLKIAVERTIKWARRCALEYQRQLKSRALKKPPLLFAVIQGGDNPALREHCAQELIKVGFAGFGFGARPVDEAGNFLNETLTLTANLIPENKLRFALGVGRPEDIIKAVKMGWDMFDCVIPTREGRHGRLFLQNKPAQTKNFYQTANIANAKFADDFSPINVASNLSELQTYSKSYLHYLFSINEPLGLRLASLNNLEFYIKMLSEIRRLIKNGQF